MPPDDSLEDEILARAKALTPEDRARDEAKRQEWIANNGPSGNGDHGKSKPKKAPLTFEEIVNAKCIPLNELKHLIDEEIQYAIKPISPRGTLTMVQGMPKAGKSTFSLWIAECAAIGHWPSGIFEIKKPLKVLFIEFEDSKILTVKRASRYLAGAGFDPYILPSEFIYCEHPTLWLDSPKYEEALTAEIKLKGYELIVIDTLSFVHQAESENDSADMKVLTAALKRIVTTTNCSIIFIHHTGKGAKDKAVAEASRGSSAIPACADVIMNWGDREGGNITPLSIISKYDDSLNCTVEYIRKDESGSVEWRVEREEKPEAAPRGQRGTEAVFLALQQIATSEPEGVRQSSVVAMMADQSMPKPSVLRHLGELVAQGKITKRLDGRAVLYSFPGTAREA